MLSHANMIKELVTRAANRFAELKTMPAASIPATIDKDQSDDQNGKRLQGSILRVAQPQGGPKYFAVAVLGQAFKMTAQGPKLSLIDKWGEAAKEKKLSDLGREEDISVVVGVLTFPTAAGANASNLKLGASAAEIRPGSRGSGIDSVTLQSANAAREQALDGVMTALTLEWQPWLGVPGGISGRPTATGLANQSQLSALSLTADALLGGMDAGGRVLAVATLKAMGLFDANGAASPLQIGGFLAAFAGVPEAKSVLAVGLAASGEDTEVKKAATAVGKEATGALQGLAAGLDHHLAQQVCGQAVVMTQIGLTAEGEQLGLILANAVQAAQPAPPLGGGGGNPGTGLAAGGGAGGGGGAADGGGATGAPPAALMAGTADGGAACGGTGGQAAFDAYLDGLNLPAATRAVLKAAREEAAQREAEPQGGTKVVLLRPAGSHPAIFSDAQVMVRVATALGATIASLAASLAGERGIAQPTSSSVFGGDDDTHAATALTDWLHLVGQVKSSSQSALVTDQPPPDSWEAAARRMRAVIDAARRAGAGQATDSAASPSAGATAARVSEEDKAAWFKPLERAAKGDSNFAVTGEMLTPLANVEFARAEALATKGSTPLLEARRLCTTGDEEARRASWSLIYSNGTTKGPAPKGGVAASVVDARYRLQTALEAQIEAAVGARRVNAVADKITALASAVLSVRAVTADGKVDESGMYALAVFLLGGTPPADEDATDKDTVGTGTWGTRAGAQSAVDIPMAMAKLAMLIGMAHCVAGGAPMGKAVMGGDGFKLEAMARRVVGSLTPDKVEEAMADLFARAQNAAARRRSRLEAPVVDWLQLVADVAPRKLTPLLAEQRAEAAVERKLESGRKSPRSAGDDEGDTKTPKKSRSEKKQEWLDKQKAAKTATQPQQPQQQQTQQTQQTQQPQQPQAPRPGAGGGGAAPDLAPGAIKKLADKSTHQGAVEALQRLYIARHPERTQREAQPCPFAAIRMGGHTLASSDATCKEGGDKGKCAQCDGWKATAEAQRVPFHREDVEKVKAACVPAVQRIFAQMALS